MYTLLCGGIHALSASETDRFMAHRNQQENATRAKRMHAAVSSLALPRAPLPGQSDEGDAAQAQALSQQQSPSQALPSSPTPGIAARTADLARSLSHRVVTVFQPPPIPPAASYAQGGEGDYDDDDDGDDVPPTPAADLSLAAAQQASCAASDILPKKLFRNASSRRTASGGGRAMSGRTISGGKGDIESSAPTIIGLPVDEEEEAQCPVSVGEGGGGKMLLPRVFSRVHVSHPVSVGVGGNPLSIPSWGESTTFLLECPANNPA